MTEKEQFYSEAIAQGFSPEDADNLWLEDQKMNSITSQMAYGGAKAAIDTLGLPGNLVELGSAILPKAVTKPMGDISEFIFGERNPFPTSSEVSTGMFGRDISSEAMPAPGSSPSMARKGAEYLGGALVPGSMRGKTMLAKELGSAAAGAVADWGVEALTGSQGAGNLAGFGTQVLGPNSIGVAKRLGEGIGNQTGLFMTDAMKRKAVGANVAMAKKLQETADAGMTVGRKQIEEWANGVGVDIPLVVRYPELKKLVQDAAARDLNFKEQILSKNIKTSDQLLQAISSVDPGLGVDSTSAQSIMKTMQLEKAIRENHLTKVEAHAQKIADELRSSTIVHENMDVASQKIRGLLEDTYDTFQEAKNEAYQAVTEETKRIKGVVPTAPLNKAIQSLVPFYTADKAKDPRLQQALELANTIVSRDGNATSIGELTALRSWLLERGRQLRAGGFSDEYRKMNTLREAVDQCFDSVGVADTAASPVFRPQGGRPADALAQKAIEDLRFANQKNRELAEIFKDGTTGKLFKVDAQGGYKIPDGDTIKVYLRNPTTVRSMKKAIGWDNQPDLQAAVTSYYGHEMLGKKTHEAQMAWLDKKGTDGLWNELPGVKDKLEKLSLAQEKARKYGEDLIAFQEEYSDDVAQMLLTNPRELVYRTFNTTDKFKRKQLIDGVIQATKGEDAIKDYLARGLWKSMWTPENLPQGSTPVDRMLHIDTNRVLNEINEHADSYEALYGKDWPAMKKTAEQLASVTAWVQKGIKGDASTQLDTPNATKFVRAIVPATIYALGLTQGNYWGLIADRSAAFMASAIGDRTGAAARELLADIYDNPALAEKLARESTTPRKVRYIWNLNQVSKQAANAQVQMRSAHQENPEAPYMERSGR